MQKVASYADSAQSSVAHCCYCFLSWSVSRPYRVLYSHTYSNHRESL